MFEALVVSQESRCRFNKRSMVMFCALVSIVIWEITAIYYITIAVKVTSISDPAHTTSRAFVSTTYKN